MSKQKPEPKSKPKPKQIVSIRNHLSPMVRLRKAVFGSFLLALSLFLLLGPRWEGDSTILLVLSLGVAFIAFGLAWSDISQAAMSWSRQCDFDFGKNEVRQRSASLMGGRSRAFVLPFVKIANFEVKMGAVAGEGGDADEAMIELQDTAGRPIIKAGMFETKEEAEALVKRISQAIAMAIQQEKQKQ